MAEARKKQRLFVDIDGTLAVFTPVDTLETLYEQGYFLNLAPHENVVAAVKEIVANHPEIEVNILSAYLTDSQYALQEKNEWLDRYLPEIDQAHRVFVPCGSDKKEGISGGIRSDDFLLDDYTHNLNEWQPPARGIKLLNAINHTRGSWEHDRIRYDRTPTDLADGILSIMRDEKQIFDEKINESGGSQVRNALESRVTGDELLNAQDLIEELRAVGADIDEDGYVTVYHRTDHASEENIKSSHVMVAKEDGLFFSTVENGQNEGYGDSVVKLSIPVEKLVLDDIFSDEAHLRYPLENGIRQLDISDYLVEEREENMAQERPIGVKPAPTDLAEKIVNFMENYDPAFGYAEGVTGQENKEQWIDTTTESLLQESGDNYISYLRELSEQTPEAKEEADAIILEIMNYEGKLPNLNQMPVSEVATLDFVNNPDRQGTGGLNRDSRMFEAMLLHTMEQEQTELYRRYDEAFAAANLKDDFQPKIAILQLREGEENHNRRFTSLETLDRILHEQPNCENYELVYLRNAEAKAETEQERERLNNQLYAEFNANTLRPRDYYGHSLSVGDVIVMTNDFSEQHAYYVDDMGFTKLPDDFLSHEMSAKIRNDLDIRQEGALYETIGQFEAENTLSIMDKTATDRYFQITSEYSRIFELADRRGAIMDMDALGYEPAQVDGFSDDFLMWKPKNENEEENTFGFDGWDAVRDFTHDVQTLMNDYTVQQLRDRANGDYSVIEYGSFGDREVETAINNHPQDEYRRQVQAIYEYEVANNIPENDRMTKWYDEMNISVAKPWYKENDPSVMDRAVGDRRIPISEAAIAARYAEISREQQERTSSFIAENEPLVDISNLDYDEDGYLHFTVTADDYELEGLYRIYDPANGDSMTLVSIDYGNQHPIIERQWDRIENALYDITLDRYNAMDRPTLAEDITNIKGVDRQYNAGMREMTYTFECDVRGTHDILTYEVSQHDDGEGYTIHTENNDIWESMSEPELRKLEAVLSREATYFLWQQRIENAVTVDDLREVRYGFMEAENLNLSQAQRELIWDGIDAKQIEIERSAQEMAQETNYTPIPNRYYEPDLDLDGTAEELFTQARNGYIENPDALHRLTEILEQENRAEEAERVRYMEEREREEDTSLYSVAQMKLDFMDGIGGIDDVSIEDGLNLSVMYEPSNDSVVVSLSRMEQDGNEDVLSTGAASMTLDEFKQMSRADFERFVGEVNAYNMVEQERVPSPEREQEHTHGDNIRNPFNETNFKIQPVDNGGFDYTVIDKWQDDNASYVVGQLEADDGTWYAAKVTDTTEQYHGEYEYEFSTDKPTRSDVEDMHLNHISEIAIDRHEAEYGADGSRNFPNLNDPSPEEQAEELRQIVAEKSAPVEIDETLPPKDQLKQRLENGVRQVLDSEQFKNWLTTGGKLFYNNYSFRNAMLVWLQKPDASYVMGYEKWKDFGRNVKQGAQGAKIFIPLMASEKYKGGLFRSIKSNLTDQLSKDPSLTEASYRLGTSNLEFTMNRANHLIGFKVNGKEQQIFGSDDEAKRFIDRAIIGKVPTGFTVGTVFDAKDVIVPEYLWVKSGYTKEEIAPDEKGNPVKNRRGEVRIFNTPERQARFQTELDTRIVAKDPVKMQALFDACVAASERKGVPVSLAEKADDSTLDGGAKGYFSRQFTEDKPNGFIVIDNSLEITEKCAVLFHEMGHADLHKNLEALAKSMGEDKITREMREVQAEATAYAVASTFGIETDTSSFQYLAAYARGFELQDFQKSLDVIYRETQALTNDIKAELDIRGLNLDLTEKPKEMLNKETLETLSTKYMDFAAEQGSKVQAALNELPSLVKQSAGNPELMDVLKYQKANLDSRKADLDTMLTAIENLNTADTREKQDEIISTLDAAMNRVNGDAYAFENLSENYVVITERARGGLKVDFEQNPHKTLEAMKKDYPALAKLSEPQLQYLATSKFVAREFTKLLRDNPQEFVDKACERAALISKAASKNGTFVEVNFCEQWTDKPFFEKGTLCSPKIADKTVTGCEAQARGFSAEAEKRGDYFPYTKCDLTIFTPNKDGKLISLNTRVDIGDGAQTSLKDHLEQLCKRGSERKEVLANFTEALTERADKRKLLVQDLSAKPQSAEQPEMTTEKEGNMSREEWDGQIKDAREKAAQEQREKAAEKAQNKSNRDRAE